MICSAYCSLQMAFQLGDKEKSELMDVSQTLVPHEEGIKSEAPFLDLEGSNSSFGIPFTMDDTWTKTPLMEELDALATNVSTTSSLGDDEEGLRPPQAALSLTPVQYRVQGSKITKLPSPQNLSFSKSLGRKVEARPVSPILAGGLEESEKSRLLVGVQVSKEDAWLYPSTAQNDSLKPQPGELISSI